MPGRLPDTLRLGPVHLRVSDLDRSIEYYQHVLGLQVRERNGGVAHLGAGSEDLLVLAGGCPGPQPKRAAGLYHFALLVPSRRDLALALRHFGEVTRLQGVADHKVSEAIYLGDPDGLGIEVYRDRPRAEWRDPDGVIRLVNDPLDVEGIMGELESHPGAWNGLPGRTVMGHVHLQVSNLDETKHFYVDLLGFDLIAALPQALFVSAGGYHHHVGLNTWHSRGGPPAPEDTAGMDRFTIRLGSQDALETLTRRVRDAGVPIEAGDAPMVVHDPPRNRLVFEA